ncbi:MAG TPA: hypothetical protein DDW50_20140 [Firmicutes bacterium]|jgi:hypothetical protein|nr:hypothetical protein [Bacillota bacterium]
MSKFEKLKFDQVKTYHISERENKVEKSKFATALNRKSTLEEYLESLPDILMGKEFKEFVSHFRTAIREKNTVIWMMGAHVIKCGLSPLIISLIKRKYISHVALNGAGAIHDVEIAMWGNTSEDVAKGLKDGSFGMCQDTAEFINLGLKENFHNELGYGELLGEKLLNKQAPYSELSIIANCVKAGVPISVHPALGTEIIQQHPSLDGASFGEKALLDFQVFANSLSKLKNGSIVLNVGSAVILPEVFLKALTVVRNLNFPAYNFHTAVFDMNRHYRPTVNVQNRPTMDGGDGYYFIGYHEIMLPLLIGLMLE